MQSLSVFRSLAVRQLAHSATRSSKRSLSDISWNLRPFPSRPLRPHLTQSRFSSSLTVPESEAEKVVQRPLQPSYQLTFTCKPCKHRSAHVITKHGYHKGTVLIKCPSCSNRHVISDHLKIFMDEKSTLEDILKRKGDLTNLLKKGKLGMRQGEIVGREGDEDIEFWDDGSQSEHTPAQPQTSNNPPTSATSP